MLTDEQLAIRQSRLSATDFGVILGLNEWRNAADLALEKRGALEPLPPTDEQEIGNRLEPAVLHWGAESIGAQLDMTAARTIVHPSLDWLCATPDAGIVGANQGAEAKTAGIKRGFALRGVWGDEDSADVPDLYTVQAQIQMAVTGWELVWLFALIAGRGFARFQIARDDDMIGELVEIGERWHRKHIVNADPVEGVLPSLETLARVRREPGSWAEIDPALVDTYESLGKMETATKESREEVKRKILDSLGDAEGARLPDGRVLTYLKQQRKAYTVKATEFRKLSITKETK